MTYRDLNQDQNTRPWLYRPDMRTEEDLRKLGIPKRPSLWPTVILGAALGIALAMIGHAHNIDPMAQAVSEAIRRLWS